jgi:hypothetical protein
MAVQCVVLEPHHQHSRGCLCRSTVVATYGFHWDKDEGSIPSGGRILGNCSEERAHMDQNMLNCQVNMVEKDGRSKGNRHCCSGVEESNVMRSKLGT